MTVHLINVSKDVKSVQMLCTRDNLVHCHRNSHTSVKPAATQGKHLLYAGRLTTTRLTARDVLIERKSSMAIRLWSRILYGGYGLSPAIRAIIALLLAVFMFPFGVLMVTILWSAVLQKDLAIPPELGGSLKDSRRFVIVTFVGLCCCCFTIVGVCLAFSFFDQSIVTNFADLARYIANYSIFANQIEANEDLNFNSIINNSDTAVIRSYVISIFPSIFVAVFMHVLNDGVKILAGLSVLVKKVSKPYGWGTLAVLFSIILPSILFLLPDDVAATAGLFPRIVVLSESYSLIALFGCVSLVGAISAWTTVLIVLNIKNKSKSEKSN